MVIGLDAIATHSVPDRPNRFEPSVRKRRKKKYDRMMKPILRAILEMSDEISQPEILSD